MAGPDPLLGREQFVGADSVADLNCDASSREGGSCACSYASLDRRLDCSCELFVGAPLLSNCRYRSK